MGLDEHGAPKKEWGLLQHEVQLITEINALTKTPPHDVVAAPGLIPHAAPKACSTAVDEPSVFVKLGLHGPGAELIGGLSLSPLFQNIFST